MMLLTKDLKAKLLENGLLPDGVKKSHLKPVVKFFTPDGAVTWLISEMAPDEDTMFGLCDMGLGFPELGYVSLAELSTLKGKLGLPVERDYHFHPEQSLADYAEEATKLGRIVA